MVVGDWCKMPDRERCLEVRTLRSGHLARERIIGDLFSLVRGSCPGRGDPSEITLFKSVGTALEDLAAAQLAVSRIGLQ